LPCSRQARHVGNPPLDRLAAFERALSRDDHSAEVNLRGGLFAGGAYRPRRVVQKRHRGPALRPPGFALIDRAALLAHRRLPQAYLALDRRALVRTGPLAAEAPDQSFLRSVHDMTSTSLLCGAPRVYLWIICFAASSTFNIALSNSLVLMIPTTAPFSATGSAPTLCLIISRAAVSAVSWGLTITGHVVIAAATCVDSRLPS